MLSTKGVAKIEALTREKLYAPPPREVQMIEKTDRKRCIWFILPAIATGDTTNLCLEYGSRFEPKTIYISIVLARMDSTLMSFYQNITGYRDCNHVNIEILSALPITAHPSESSCPMCGIEKAIEAVRQKTEGYELLSRIVYERNELFRVKEITIKYLNDNAISVATDQEKDRLLMRIRYEEAIRSFEHRKDLGAMLSKQGGADIFIDMIGNEFLSKLFDEQTIKTATYNRYDDILKAAQKLLDMALDMANDKGLSLIKLLGIHRLFPKLLIQNIGSIFLNAIKVGNRQLCEDIVFLALISPEKYGVYITTSWIEDKEIKEIWLTNLIEEIRTYPSWHDTESGAAIKEFTELLWLLRRSTPWGSNIEYLRSVIKTANCTPLEMKKAFQVLEEDGIKAVLHHINQLKAMGARIPGGLWSAIKSESRTMEQIINGIENKRRDIKTNLESVEDSVNRDVLLKILSELDEYGKQLTKELEKLFTNPIDAKMRIMEIKDNKWPSSHVDIRFTIAADQPGVLISLEDLIQSINCIIDNANTCVDEFANSKKRYPEDPWIEFCFNGYTQPDKSAAMLLVKDNLPWSRIIEPEGGMKQFIQYCHKYAASYNFNPQYPDESVKIIINYRIDKIGDRHEYR